MATLFSRRMVFPLIGFPPLSPLAFVTFAFYGAAANIGASHGFADRPVGGASVGKQVDRCNSQRLVLPVTPWHWKI